MLSSLAISVMPDFVPKVLLVKDAFFLKVLKKDLVGVSLLTNAMCKLLTWPLALEKYESSQALCHK